MMRFVLLFWASACLTLIGCRTSNEPVVVQPVRGKVIYASRPAAEDQVFFFLVIAANIPDIPMNPRGTTGLDGQFKLTTFEEGDGAAEGGYQVILLWPPKLKEGEESDSDRLFGWYDAAHSKIRVQIAAGDNNLKPFELPAV